MPPVALLPPNRRFLLALLLAIGLISLLSWTFSHAHTPTSVPIHQVNVDANILQGEVISSKIGNETVKAELGRAAWKLLHTTMAKFPDKPSQEEQTALFSYIHLFARLYPWWVLPIYPYKMILDGKGLC